MSDDNRRQLAAEVRETVPRAPGVYAFFDGDGRLLYVGKSVSLRQRVGNYLGQDHLTSMPPLGQLVTSIRSFAWWQTRSELLALLLEDVLIKEHLPQLNTRLKELAENRYLEFTDGDFPACLIVEHVTDFGTRDVFGPLRDKYFAAALQDVLHETLGIRTCSELEPAKRCLEYDIGRCSGPCRGVVEVREYQELVALARSFLRGNAETVLDRLVDARDRAAEAKRYEEAAGLRDAIDTCRRFAAHERFGGRFTGGDCRIRCAEDGVEYRFAEGALVAPRDVVVAQGQSERQVVPHGAGFLPEAAGRDAVATLHQPPPADRRFLADRTRIVCNWVRRQGDGCHVWFDGVEGQVPEHDWSRLVES